MHYTLGTKKYYAFTYTPPLANLLCLRLFLHYSLSIAYHCTFQMSESTATSPPTKQKYNYLWLHNAMQAQTTTSAFHSYVNFRLQWADYTAEIDYSCKFLSPPMLFPIMMATDATRETTPPHLEDMRTLIWLHFQGLQLATTQTGPLSSASTTLVSLHIASVQAQADTPQPPCSVCNVVDHTADQYTLSLVQRPTNPGPPLHCAASLQNCNLLSETRWWKCP
jgi:hypothetical protein